MTTLVTCDMGGSHELPPHKEQLRALRELDVTIGQNVLNQSQAEAMSKLLYSTLQILVVPGNATMITNLDSCPRQIRYYFLSIVLQTHHLPMATTMILTYK